MAAMAGMACLESVAEMRECPEAAGDDCLAAGQGR